MTREEHIENLKAIASDMPSDKCSDWIESLMAGVKALQQEPCEMTAEEYRQKMIQAFHNADCDELIALVVLPTEKEFEHLEWLLERHYKAKPEPVQVELEGDGYADGQLVYDWGKCPKCGWDFEYGEKDWEEPYCCHCGQKLHWFEEQEMEE